jgi:multidrug resistance efflux pump
MTGLSPTDATVAEIKVSDRSSVTAGTVILTLDSNAEDLRIARVGALDTLRGILAARLGDDAIGLERQLAQIPIDANNALIPNLTKLRDQVANGEILGAQPPGAASTISYSITALQFGGVTADLQRQLKDVSINMAKEMNDILANHLKAELQAANALKDQTVIRAPISGMVHLQVVQGLFVRRGTSLFEIS